MRRALVTSVLSVTAVAGVVAALIPPVQAATAAPARDSHVGAAVAVTSAALTSAALTSASTSAVSPRTKSPRTKGSRGQTLTVTPSRDLSSFGQTVTVRGKRFNELVGIYVGLCVLPRPGAKPTPCGGGVDQDGSSRASAWISSNPPPYGAQLAIPYKRGGSFAVTIRVSPRIGSIDCRVTRCAVVARADHMRSNDRSWDVAVPVTFRR